jgi:hypothetical protein
VSAPPPHPASGEWGTRLANAVAGLGDEEWLRELRAMGARPDRKVAEVPTYEDLVGAGLEGVVALVGEARWEDAARASERLNALLRLNRHYLHPVAAESFDGLRAAVLARDAEEVDDFVALIDEIFGGSRG